MGSAYPQENLSTGHETILKMIVGVLNLFLDISIISRVMLRNTAFGILDLWDPDFPYVAARHQSWRRVLRTIYQIV